MSNKADAYSKIDLACKLETNAKLLPKHLIFKAQLAQQIGYNNEAAECFEQANELSNQYHDYYQKPENRYVIEKIKNYKSNNA